MIRRPSLKFLLFVLLVPLGIIPVYGQSADSRSPLYPQENGEDRRPKGIREMMAKMRIEQSKKEYEQMLERSEEAQKLAADLVAAVETKSELSRNELDQVEDLEKLVKKIRGELGGDEDDEPDVDQAPTDVKEAITRLSAATSDLLAELKRMTRFSISAAAIKTTNAIIRLSRFVRSGK